MKIIPQIVLGFVLLISACKSCNKVGESENINRGIGPIKELQLSPIDENMSNQGKALFETKCSACHKIDEKYVGPDLKGVTKRRSPEWIMNMMLNPVEMTQKDPIAKELLANFLLQMTFQDLSQDDARKILEYFRFTDNK